MFLKYCTVGSVGALIDLSVLYLLVDVLQIDIILAATFSFIVAVTSNFILNKIWTFTHPTVKKEYKHIGRSQYFKFVAISIIGLILTLSLMYVFNKIYMIWYIYAKILTSGMVLLWNYYANKNWTFAHK